jgi:Siphovirus ReqiPepy6 Gp37-like protein
MEVFTLDRNFHKQDIIDAFLSIIWTERYSGDSGVEIVVPATRDMINVFPVGTFLGISDSHEVMILETGNIESGKLKVTGISLLSWMDNRFVRTSKKHEDKYWYLEGMPPGQILATIIHDMCMTGSPYLDNDPLNTYDNGIANPEQLVVPGLTLADYDTSGDNVKIGVPYGPVYKAMKEIANTYEIGQQITLDAVYADSYVLGYRNYKGIDRTSAQSLVPVVRFSPQMDSFTDIKEVESIAAFKTRAYAFAPSNPDGLANSLDPGVFNLSEEYTGFDLRALLVLAEDITTDQVSGSAQNLKDMLSSRARDGVATNAYTQAVDGEIVPTSQFKYGVHYNLGDIIEVQGNSGVVKMARITEYIRSKDPAGEKAYPTVKAL